MTTHATQILTLSDAGNHPDAISAALSISLAAVYTTLRRERPNRTRKPRARSSKVTEKVTRMAQVGIKVGRIAELCSCSRAYVYRILAEQESGK